IPVRDRVGAPPRGDGGRDSADQTRGSGGSRAAAAPVTVPLGAYIVVSAALFFIGCAGVLVRRNAVVILMCVELMLNAANLALVLSALVSIGVFLEVLGGKTQTVVPLYRWIAVGDFSINVSALVDPLSSTMLLVVTVVSFLIFVYSNGYMAHDAGFHRFFSWLSLFVFAMLILVMADNYLLMFVGWEGVGLCSYLLIGFWFERP